MPTFAMFILDDSMKAEAEVHDSEDGMLGPRQIDNPIADNLQNVGPFTGSLLGKWVSPARLLNDPSYIPFRPTLSQWGVYVLDSDTLFLPEDE